MGWGCWYVRAATQKDLDGLEKWPDGNFTQFNKHIRRVQHLGLPAGDNGLGAAR